MPGPLWTGSLSFGLVNVRVSVVGAVRDIDVHFNQVHAHDGAPIEVQRWCSAEDVEIPYEEVTRAHELEDGRQVLVSDRELEALAPERTRTIEIERFVDLREVDPLYFAHPYFLIPAEDEASLRAYRLLTEVLARTGRAALGRFVMRTKEYLVIVRERCGALSLETMRFADEIRPTDEIDAADEDALAPTPAELETAVSVIGELTAEWDPTTYVDHHRERLLALIDRKRRGEPIEIVAEGGQPKPAPDLMAALQGTLEQLRVSGRSSRRSAPRGSR